MSLIDLHAAPYVPPLTGGGDGGFSIRQAEPGDLIALIAMGEAFFRESAPTRFSFDPALDRKSVGQN